MSDLASPTVDPAELYRLLVDACPDPLILGSDTAVLFVNPAGARWLGLDCGGPDGAPADNRKNETRSKGWVPSFTAVPGSDVRGQLQLTRADGSRRVAAAKATSVNWQGLPATLYLVAETNGESPRIEPPLRQADSRITLLIVDDEPDVADLCRRVLARSDYHVLVAQGGRAGLAMFQEHLHVIGMVLTDVNMPELDGWELSKRIRALRPDVKILFVSSVGDDGETDAQRSMLDSGAEVLGKPFTTHRLLAKVKAMLAR